MMHVRKLYATACNTRCLIVFWKTEAPTGFNRWGIQIANRGVKSRFVRNACYRDLAPRLFDFSPISVFKPLKERNDTKCKT